MKAFIDEYGTTCVVVLVIVTLIGFITLFKDPLLGYYENILESFFNQATSPVAVLEQVRTFL